MDQAGQIFYEVAFSPFHYNVIVAPVLFNFCDGQVYSAD